jgi:ABC-type amino acid transport substrate-binding protein
MKSKKSLLALALVLAFAGTSFYLVNNDGLQGSFGGSTLKLRLTTTLMGTYDTSYAANEVVVSGSYAYVADLSGGLVIVDVSVLMCLALQVRGFGMWLFLAIMLIWLIIMRVSML